MLHEGFKTWNAKRKLQYENISMENEPQQNEWHEHLSSVHFSLSESFEFLVRFSCPTCPIYRPTCSVDSNADSHQQNTAKRKANLSRGSRLVDKETRGSEGMLVLSLRKILTIFHGNIAYFEHLKMFFFFNSGGFVSSCHFPNVDVFVAPSMILQYIHPCLQKICLFATNVQ